VTEDAGLVKCVVWDLDHTLLDGVYLEAAPGQPPPADPVLAGVARELAGRGILQAVASRNPPAAAEYAAQAAGLQLAAAQCGWDSKAGALGRIAAELDLAPGSLALVDDDIIERAEVAAAWPDVLVLTPQDAAEAPGWPAFSPPVVTPEAARRGAAYAERRRRQQAAAEFGGSRAEFLRRAGTRVTIGPAAAGDRPRLHELAVRTHQLNSAGSPVSAEELDQLAAAAGSQAVTVRLCDDFGDDGLVGAAILAGPPPSMSVPLVMMSCRALGRGALDALLAWLCRVAAAEGAGELAVPCAVTERNVPFRLALAGAGFRAPDGPAVPAGGRVRVARPLAGEPPALADYVTAPVLP
jgi:FkbH-like protein